MHNEIYAKICMDYIRQIIRMNLTNTKTGDGVMYL